MRCVQVRASLSDCAILRMLSCLFTCGCSRYFRVDRPDVEGMCCVSVSSAAPFEAWRNFELDRRDGLLTDLEHRQAYNAMLQEMSGQLPRPRKDPRRHLPNSCTKRVGHLAMPKQPRHHGNVTQLSDYRGLIHVDHDRALEARHRGTGEACEAL